MDKYLNTSHVKVQQSWKKKKEKSLSNLNTSHVKVQLQNYNTKGFYYGYLNTSHVKVQRLYQFAGDHRRII